MEPVTAIALAKVVATATGLDDWLSKKLGKTISDRAAKKIMDVAMAATGTVNPQDAVSVIKESPEFAIEARRQIMANEHQITMTLLEDVKSARDMYKVQHDTADDIARRVTTQNHLAVMLLIIANGLVLVYVNDQMLAVAAGNLIGGSIAALWAERQQVLNFYFGSSWGSKIKDAVGLNKSASHEQ